MPPQTMKTKWNFKMDWMTFSKISWFFWSSYLQVYYNQLQLEMHLPLLVYFSFLRSFTKFCFGPQRHVPGRFVCISTRGANEPCVYWVSSQCIRLHWSPVSLCLVLKDGTFTDSSLCSHFPYWLEVKEETLNPLGGGRQHMILPNFAKNCMKLRTFWAVGGGLAGGAPPQIRHWSCYNNY